MGTAEIPPLPPRLEEIEEMPEPATPSRMRIALAVSLMVLAVAAVSCFALTTSVLPPPEATAEGAQDVVEEFIASASSGDTSAMQSLLAGEAARSMDEAVLRSISEYVTSRVGTPLGFNRSEQQILQTGPNQRIYLTVTAGGTIGKIQARTTLVYRDGRWSIERIEIR